MFIFQHTFVPHLGFYQQRQAITELDRFTHNILCTHSQIDLMYKYNMFEGNILHTGKPYTLHFYIYMIQSDFLRSLCSHYNAAHNIKVQEIVFVSSANEAKHKPPMVQDVR